MALITIGRYTLENQIGTGGMATVYRGYDPRLARDVAVKLLLGDIQGDPALRGRFEREAHTIARLEHPAIVPVYDFGEDQGQLYLVMRLMTGGSLQERLRRGALPVDAAARIVQRLADALDTAHGQGIIHRDLKPGNILFDEYDNPMISDFGIAKLALQAGAATLTQTGSLVGTPAYMSPEQVRGESDIDRRSDLYSFGIIVYEMLTGRLPFKADTPYGLLMQHVIAPVPILQDSNPTLPAGCQSVIARALAKPREERFPTAGALSDALNQAVGLRETRHITPPPEAGATLLPDLSATGYVQPDAAADALDRIRAATPVPRPPKRRLAWPVLALIGIGVFGVLLLGIAVAGFALSRLTAQTATPLAAASPTLAVVTSPPTAVPLTAAPPSPAPTPILTDTPAAPTQAAVPIASIANGTLNKDYADPPEGRVELGGIVFELDGQAFRSQADPAPNNAFPTEAGIDVELVGVSRVFVLITAGDGFTRWRGRTVGEIVLTFADAEPVVVELVLGENLREWHAADNVVSDAEGVVEVWRGPIARFPDLEGTLDLLVIVVPEDRQDARLVRIDFRDTSFESVGSRDPAITVAGLVIEHR